MAELVEVKRIGKVADDYILELEKISRKFEKQILANLDNVLAVSDVAVIKSQIDQILIDTGYYEAADALVNVEYQKILDGVDDYYRSTAGGIGFTADSLERLEAIRNLDLGQILEVPRYVSQEIERGIIAYQFGAMDKSGIMGILEKQAGVLARDSGTIANTMIFGFYQQASNELAEELGIERYEYIGPDDKITRPFCNDHLGDILTKDEINQLDNGQGLTVFQFGGGYNCRHIWTPYTKDISK